MDATECEMRFWGKRGGTLLAAAIVFLLLMAVGAFTPIVWILTGRPSESYPELLFAFYGLPLGMLLVATAGVRYWLKNRGPST